MALFQRAADLKIFETVSPNLRGIRMKLTKFALGAAVALASMHTYVATAEQTAQQAIEARQQHFKDIGAAFKVIRDEIRKSQPDQNALVGAATKMDQLSKELPNWFAKGTGPEAGVKTDAKPEIWSDAKGFQAAAAKFQTEAPKLLALAQANDIAGIQKQVGAIGGACKGCHDNYRVPQN
jgi:cytochrome c556